MPFSSKAGFNSREFFSVVPARMQPSLSTTPVGRGDRHDFILQFPAACAAAALACDMHGEMFPARGAMMLYFLATFSAVVPMLHIGLRIIFGEQRVRHRVKARHRHARHAFDARADKRFARAHLDGAGGHVNALHRRAAETVDRRARDRQRQLREKPISRATFNPCSPSGKGAAEQQIFQIVRVDLGAFDQRA